MIRRAFMVAFVAVFPFGSVAQQPQQQQVYTLQISDTDLAVIGRALEAMSYRDAAPVIGRLQQQLNALAEKAKRDERSAPEK
jgi:hypothetical protein